MNLKQKYIITFFTAFVVLILDQFSKFLIKQNIQSNQSIPLIKNILHLTYVTNTGTAFGLFKNINFIFIIISFVVIILIINYIKKLKNKKNSVYALLGLLLGGTLGNLIDRIFFGYVIDFIDFRVWPVFNAADSFITISIIGLIIYYWNK